MIWLAGPAAGLFCQPIVGSLSDADTSRYRRRKYIVGSFIFSGFFALLVAYASPTARVLLRVFTSVEEWDPNFHHIALTFAIWIAVPAFWGLDFSLNALQASSRALLLDTVPGFQQPSANAWQGKVTQLGNVVGYGLGFTDLGNDKLLRHIPGGQFGRLVVVGLIVSGACVALTCTCVQERPRTDEMTEDEEDEKEAAALRILKDIRTEIMELPVSVRRVCFAQFFSWIGWYVGIPFEHVVVEVAQTSEPGFLSCSLPPHSSVNALRKSTTSRPPPMSLSVQDLSRFYIIPSLACQPAFFCRSFTGLANIPRHYLSLLTSSSRTSLYAISGSARSYFLAVLLHACSSPSLPKVEYWKSPPWVCAGQ